MGATHEAADHNLHMTERGTWCATCDITLVPADREASGLEGLWKAAGG